MAVLDQIKNMEEQKKALMARLGELYYQTLKSAGEHIPAEEAEIVTKIDDMERQMKRLTGAEAPALEEEPSQLTEYQGSVCPKCGAPVEPDQVFCVNCGARLDTEMEKEEVETSQEAEAGSVCPRCGAPVESGQSFCVVCGNRLRKRTAPEDRTAEM